jgi:DNA-binding HxlR family transcriptional regulator
MSRDNRSNCPIAFALDLFGDKWSLLILRDAVIFEKRFYHEFADSAEGISTNILANRLARLEEEGLLIKSQDENNKKKNRYTPTAKSLDLLPMIIEMVLWSYKYDPDTGAPKAVIDRLINDREGYISKIRHRAKMP